MILIRTYFGLHLSFYKRTQEHLKISQSTERSMGDKDKRIAVFSLGVSLPDVEKAIDILNYKNNRRFFFKIFSSDQIEKLMENDKEVLRMLNIHSIMINHVTCVISKYILPFCERIRKKLNDEYTYEFLIIITPFSLFESESDAPSAIEAFGGGYAGYFVIDDNNKCCIVSTKNLDEFSKKAGQPLKISLSLLLISTLVMLFTNIDPENMHLDQNGHPTSIGCLNDYCESLDEIVPSLMAQKFCKSCADAMKMNEIGRSIIELVEHVRNLPWYYDQPVSFWLSVVLLPLGLALLGISKINNSIPVMDSLGTVSSVLGSFLLGLSRLVKKDN